MSDDDIIYKSWKKYEHLSGVLVERSRRIWASAEAEANFELQFVQNFVYFMTDLICTIWAYQYTDRT